MSRTRWHANIVWKQGVFDGLVDIVQRVYRIKNIQKEFVFSLADELAAENKESIHHSSDVSDHCKSM